MPCFSINFEQSVAATQGPTRRLLQTVIAVARQSLPLILIFAGAVTAGTGATAEQQINCDPINTKTIQACANKQTAPREDPAGDKDAESPIGTRHKIPNEMWSRMKGVSWHRNLRCPSRNKLALLRIPHWDFSYIRRTGEMIVARDSADDILKVFASLYEEGYPIEQMVPVHKFDGNDNKSMAANNTSAFNCRLKTSKRGLSEHSYGRAIDINPVQNPYVRRGRAQPAAGRLYTSRKRRKHKAMIMRNDAVVRAFRKVGWRWGGHWRSVKDYQHFSKNGK